MQPSPTSPKCVLCLEEGIVLDKTDQFGCMCRENRFHGVCWDRFILHYTNKARCPCCRALVKQFQTEEFLDFLGGDVAILHCINLDRSIDGLYLFIGACLIGLGFKHDDIPHYAPLEVVYPSVILTFIYYVCGIYSLYLPWGTPGAITAVYQHGFNTVIMASLLWTRCLGYYWSLAAMWGLMPLTYIIGIIIIAITFRSHQHVTTYQ